jgi:hypothetical protein
LTIINTNISIQDKENSLFNQDNHQKDIRRWRNQGNSQTWILARIRGIETNREFKNTLSKFGINSMGMRICIENVQAAILGLSSAKFKQILELKKTDTVRDYATIDELNAIALAEMYIIDELIKNKPESEKAIYSLCSQYGKSIALMLRAKQAG